MDEAQKTQLDLLDDDAIQELLSPTSIFEKLELFFKSEVFVNECRKMYSEKVQTALLEKSHYRFVDALEETMDLVTIDSHLFIWPLANTYIPVRNTIMKKPNLLDQDMESDEFGYRFNDYSKNDTTRKRFHPLEQLNPLRGNRMGPGFTGVDSQYKERHPHLSKTQ